MRSAAVIRAQVLRLVIVIVAIVAFANSQNLQDKNQARTQLYKVQLSTGQVVSDTFVGTNLQGAANLVPEGAPGWSLVGVGQFRRNAGKGLVYNEHSTGALAV